VVDGAGPIQIQSEYEASCARLQKKSAHSATFCHYCLTIYGFSHFSNGLIFVRKSCLPTRSGTVAAKSNSRTASRIGR
jgi:hypothetical protein